MDSARTASSARAATWEILRRPVSTLMAGAWPVARRARTPLRPAPRPRSVRRSSYRGRAIDADRIAHLSQGKKVRDHAHRVGKARGGGPPAPSRNDGKKSINPTACAGARRREQGSRRTPRTDESYRPRERNPEPDPPRLVQRRNAIHRRGDGQARTADAAATATRPTTSWVRAKDQLGNPAAANRRSTPSARGRRPGAREA